VLSFFPDQRESAFLAEPLGDRCEADHIREQCCHLPPLSGRGSWVDRSGCGVARLNATSVSNGFLAVSVCASLGPSRSIYDLMERAVREQGGSSLGLHG